MAGLRGILTDPLLSVVMPVYNERETIEEILERVMSVKMRVELIVVDDCSKDGTREMLPDLQKKYGFKLILKEQNGGKGSALQRGFQEVTGDVMVIQDADLEYSPEEYPDLIELIAKGRAAASWVAVHGRHRASVHALSATGC
jgi:glycosyltransferase involved in cell wall biosynthesis